MVQLLIFLLRRRSEIRALDRGSDAGLLTSATELIAKQQADSDSLRHEVVRLGDSHRDLQESMTKERAHFTHQLAIAHQENVRLSAEVARLRVDHDIATRQIAELRRLDRSG